MAILKDTKLRYSVSALIKAMLRREQSLYPVEEERVFNKTIRKILMETKTGVHGLSITWVDEDTPPEWLSVLSEFIADNVTIDDITGDSNVKNAVIGFLNDNTAIKKKTKDEKALFIEIMDALGIDEESELDLEKDTDDEDLDGIEDDINLDVEFETEEESDPDS